MNGAVDNAMDESSSDPTDSYQNGNRSWTSEAHPLLRVHGLTPRRANGWIQRACSNRIALQVVLLVVSLVFLCVATTSYYYHHVSSPDTSTYRSSSIYTDGTNSSMMDRSIQDRQRRIQILEALHDLEGRINGTIYFLPEDDKDNDTSFSCAAHVWSERSVAGSHRPWVVIEVEHEVDVQITVPVLVALHTRYNFPFRVRSGGHNKAGHSTVTDGAVLSLVRLNHISLLESTLEEGPTGTRMSLADTKMARMGPAVLVQDFIREVLMKHGYGGVTGYCPTVAEGGFILGGGIGLQSRLYGLGLDNAVGMRIVLADGSVHYVSNSSPSQATGTMEKDLFWALRGAGGGSFGVVTEIDYQVHKAEDRLLYLAISLEPADMAVFLYQLGIEESNLPGNLVAMHDQIDTVGFLWSGPDEDAFVGAEDYLDELVSRWIPEHAPRQTHKMDLAWSDMYVSPKIMSKYAAPTTWGASCWYGFMMPENNTELIWREILELISAGTKSSVPYLLPDIELWGGAIHHKPWNATAFPYRAAVYNVGVLLTVPSTVSDSEEIFQREVQKVNAWWPQISQYLTGSYVNYPMTSIQESRHPDHARVYWGDNLERLVEIKQQVDPQGAFDFPLGVPITLDEP